MVRLLVIYDIASKSNILSKLKQVGTHVQNSAFELEIHESELDKFSQELSNIIGINTHDRGIEICHFTMYFITC